MFGVWDLGFGVSVEMFQHRVFRSDLFRQWGTGGFECSVLLQPVFGPMLWLLQAA